MSLAVFYKLLVLIVVVGIGWRAGRTPLLRGPDTVRVITGVAFYILAPALLFRAMARLDLNHMPWGPLVGFFGPAMLWMLLAYAWQRLRSGRQDPALASVRAITMSFGNTLQVGVPFIAALYGDAGLSLHVAIVSLHSLTLLTTGTVLAEVDLARAQPDAGEQIGRTVRQTLRSILIHPVILPVAAGLVWNLVGLRLPQPLDEVLQLMGSGVVPLCLILIGLTLAHYGVRGAVRDAILMACGKMLVMPALVLAVGHGLLGLHGVPLAVIVLGAALPSGSNALMFAQRYNSQQAQASATIVIGTVAYAAVAPFWLAVLDAMGWV